MKKVFLFFGVVGLLSSCDTTNSDDVKPHDIYQSYLYEFDAQLNKTKTHAAFQIGSNTGKYIKLTAPAAIQVNESDYDEYNNFGMYHYHFRFKGKQNSIIVFTDNTGTIYTNTIEKERLNTIGFENDITYEKGKDLLINFSGLPVQEDEKVYVNLWNGNSTNATYYQIIEGENSIIIPASELTVFGGSLVNLTIHREQKLLLEDTSDAGGELELLYSSAQIQIQM